jgi:hypothetical protein
MTLQQIKDKFYAKDYYDIDEIPVSIQAWDSLYELWEIDLEKVELGKKTLEQAKLSFEKHIDQTLANVL